jgi:hypothetical protein
MPRTLMKKPSRKFRKFLALRRKAGCVVGASLLAAGVQSRAADAVTPEQLYEGGTNTYNNWIELGGGDLIRSGNKAQAEQGAGLPGGAFGGIEDLHYQTEVAKKTTLAVDGHYLPAEHDYKLGLDLEKEDFGFIKFSYENFRTYDAANGGYSPVDAQAFPNPGDAPALDRGKISFEAGYNKEGKPTPTAMARRVQPSGARRPPLPLRICAPFPASRRSMTNRTVSRWMCRRKLNPPKSAWASVTRRAGWTMPAC